MRASVCVAVLALGVAAARADVLGSTLGRPVEAIGSSVAAVPDAPATEGKASYDPSNGMIDYYIPLSSKASGVFGVTNVGKGRTAGTRSDKGDGTGLSGTPALSMFMRFDPVPLLGAERVELTLDFVDLDLYGTRDNSWFTEAIRLLDADGNAMTPIISSASQTPGAGAAYDFAISGDKRTQRIVVDDVSDLVTAGEPMWMELQFHSDSKYRACNTSESLSAELTVYGTPVVVPEPASFALFGLGGALMLRRRR